MVMYNRNPDNPALCSQLMEDKKTCFQYLAEGREDTKCAFLHHYDSSKQTITEEK